MIAILLCFFRFFIAAYFAVSSVFRISHYEIGIAKLTQAGWSYPEFWYFFLVGAALIGAFFVLIGYRTRMGTFFLVLALGVEIYLFRSAVFTTHLSVLFSKEILLFAFLKDLSLFGGIGYLYVHGPGGIALGK